VKLLVEQGVVNVNERDERGATLAHKAAGQGHLGILQWLIEMGASMDLTTQSGETPKDVARRFSQLACLKLLGGGTDKTETSSIRHQNESQRRKMTPKEEERGRARHKYEELQKQFDLAKKNFRQLGGQLEEDEKRDAVEQDAQKYLINFGRNIFL
jgi:ankyrin repeat domain-containing protein 42